MRIAILFLLLMGFMSLSLSAQDEKNATTVYSVEGRVKYSPKAKGWFNYQTLQAGTRLSKQGRLKVKRNASMAIIEDGDYAMLSGKQRTTVDDLLKNPKVFRDDDYLSTFEAYVHDSEHPYFRQPEVLGFLTTSTQDPATTTESSPTKPPAKSSKEGHQDPSAELSPVSPSGTSVKPAKAMGVSTIFHWVPKKETLPASSAYQLEILNEEGDVIWNKSVQGNTYELDWTDVDVEAGNFYSWRASLSEDSGKNTSKVPFQFVSDDGVEGIMQQLKTGHFYTSADPTAQLLIEAAVLEENGFQAMAYERYLQAVEQSPRNELAVAMYKTFLWRYNGMN